MVVCSLSWNSWICGISSVSLAGRSVVGITGWWSKSAPKPNKTAHLLNLPKRNFQYQFKIQKQWTQSCEMKDLNSTLGTPLIKLSTSVLTIFTPSSEGGIFFLRRTGNFASWNGKKIILNKTQKSGSLAIRRFNCKSQRLDCGWARIKSRTWPTEWVCFVNIQLVCLQFGFKVTPLKLILFRD